MTQLTKPTVAANAFAQRLKLRLASTYAITQSFDTNNNPCVLIQGSAGQLGSNNLLVQFTGSVSTYNNILGQTEDFASTPTIMNCYAEALTTTNRQAAAAQILYNSSDFIANYQTELLNIYGIQQNWVVNNGTTISVAGLANTLTTAATLVSTAVPNLQTASGMASA